MESCLTYKDNQLEKSKFYYPNGNLKCEMLIDGIARGYYEDGSLLWDGYRRNGKRDGVFRRYDHDGNICDLKVYKDGVLSE